MSLQFVIDGYNVINHPKFNPPKRNRDVRLALLELIITHKLCGSTKNKITVVFDGYADLSVMNAKNSDIMAVFSQNQTADERINKLIENSVNPKTLVVVSDDKQIILFAKACGAKSMSVEEFLGRKEKLSEDNSDSLKPEINYSQMQKINQELRKLWLK
jgi:predicted RNA-binding protein with PIN domain